MPLSAITYGLDNDDVLTCTALEDEIVRIMETKFGVDVEEMRQQLAELLETSIRIAVTGILKGACRDPKDDFILECAATGNADFIVTGDKDLLSLHSHGDIAIITPRQYLDGVRDRAPSQE